MIVLCNYLILCFFILLNKNVHDYVMLLFDSMFLHTYEYCAYYDQITLAISEIVQGIPDLLLPFCLQISPERFLLF